VKDVSTIFHNGAFVNMKLPYSVLKRPNVVGTISVIRLALSSGAIVHHVSTVASIPSRQVTEEQFMMLSPIEMSQKEGYGQSKVVAERLLYEAYKKYQLDIYVYRPSTISGDTITGYSNVSDFTNLLLKTITVFQVAPIHTVYLNWIPADFVASVIIHNAVNLPQQESERDRIFHITGNGGPTLEEIVKEIEKNMSIVIKRVRPTEWKEMVKKISESYGLIYTVKEILETIGEKEGTISNLPKPKTLEWLKKNNMNYPTVDPTVFEKYLTYLQNSKYFVIPRK
jgi:thioester reductase-like protein